MGSFGNKTAYELGLVGVEEQPDGSFAFTALQDVASGMTICHMQGDRLPEATRFTVQVDKETHVDVQAPLKYTNHSCEANCRFDFDTWSLVATQDIKARNFITFNYLTTEFDMAEGFVCLCRKNSCIGEVKGFKHLDDKKKRHLLDIVSPVVKGLHILETESAHDLGMARVHQHADGTYAFMAFTEIPEGSIICQVTGPKRETPTRYSVQIDHAHHVDVGAPLKYTNHSCEPNARFDFTHWTLNAARDIQPGEQITFNYLTTEFDMAEAFDCKCSKEKCFGSVRGYKHLDEEAKKKIEDIVSPVVKMHQENGVA